MIQNESTFLSFNLWEVGIYIEWGDKMKEEEIEDHDAGRGASCCRYLALLVSTNTFHVIWWVQTN